MKDSYVSWVVAAQLMGFHGYHVNSVINAMWFTWLSLPRNNYAKIVLPSSLEGEVFKTAPRSFNSAKLIQKMLHVGFFTLIDQYKTIGMGKIFHPGAASGHDDIKYSWSLPYYHCKCIMVQ